MEKTKSIAYSKCRVCCNSIVNQIPVASRLQMTRIWMNELYIIASSLKQIVSFLGLSIETVKHLSSLKSSIKGFIALFVHPNTWSNERLTIIKMTTVLISCWFCAVADLVNEHTWHNEKEEENGGSYFAWITRERPIELTIHSLNIFDVMHWAICISNAFTWTIYVFQCPFKSAHSL